ncbi:MAG: nuclease [Pelagibacteraceae bacterium]|nr:nuclease [Pelagibacteraceae bacterium]|tara:strand:- start:2229 stop:2711 length:483 start_codon:yes stop_codon:yes gene_type:complete
MVQKILIFKLILFILLFINNFVNAKTFTGKAKIIDGDTIHINSNKIRLHGIDAPETDQKCIFKKKEWFCGRQATKELKKLIKNKIIKCEVNDIDIYNRYVAICFIDHIDLNKLMVKNGWAIAYRYYSTDYIAEENHARENKLGIWKGEFLSPYIYRKKKQ